MKLKMIKKTLTEFDKIFIVSLCLFFIMAWITMFVLARFTFKKGYEEAVKDYHNGTIKCEIVNKEVIWK